MNPAVEAFNRLAQSWAELAWAVAWQSALVVVCFALIARVMRRSSPGFRYALWQISAIKLLVMPLWTVAITLPALPGIGSGERSKGLQSAQSAGGQGARSMSGTRTQDGSAAEGDTTYLPQADRSWVAELEWPAWLLIAWIVGIAGQVAGMAYQRELLARLLRRTVAASEPALLGLVAELSQRVGLRSPPPLRIAPGPGSPFVCGLRRPALVLPDGLAGSLEPVAWRSVLLHELAHIKRGDLIWDWVPAVARVLYFFNPAAHYIGYRTRLERELACDQAAMVLAGAGAAVYASTLIEVATQSSVPPVFQPVLVAGGVDGREPVYASDLAIATTTTLMLSLPRYEE